MNGLTTLQREAARILFDLPEASGFALAGGSALGALGVIDRPTRDLDAFIAARPGDPPGDVGPLATAYRDTLLAKGWTIEVIRRHQTFTRLVATLDAEAIEIDLAVDSPPLFPLTEVDGIPTLAPQDLAARKILAILDRAEGRDFTDLWILAQRFDKTACITWAKQLDHGVDDEEIARAIDHLVRLSDDELPCIPEQHPDLRRWFSRWSNELREPRD